MRILHVVSSAQRRGAEMFACDLDTALAERGVDQRIVLLRPPPRDARVDFHSPVEVLGDGHGGARHKLTAYRSLRRLISSWEPDVIQAHGGETLKYAIPACRGRAPVVYRRIGSTPKWMAGGLRRAGHRALIRRAARVVAVSDATRAETVAIFRLDPRRVITVANGVDLERASPRSSRTSIRSRLGIPPGTSVVISVGAFTEEKDPAAQVQVARRVLDRRNDVVFLMVGDGPLAAKTRESVNAADLDGSIRLLGARTDTADLLAASDVLLLASRTEGMPGILIEAGIAGLAAAAYSLAGVPEVIDDGRTGVLAPPGEIAVLADCVIGLLDDAAARSAMGEAARLLCRERFDIRSIAPRYLDVYRELLEAQVPAQARDGAKA